jgi:aminopeptidase N
MENRRSLEFPKTPKISSYLFAVVAGPYSYIERNTAGMPPMRLYLRASVLQDVEKDVLEEMLSTSQTGMLFYKDLFGMPFQFSKYDQVFVPEFNSGAMENVGCVTFSEERLKRGQTMTLEDRLKLMNTNLHELAHQWFGNLVTMKWWSDLWLNESFATFMSYLVQTQAVGLEQYRGAWTDFMGRKFDGIAADGMSSTHPVRNTLTSLEEAEAIFDGISYGKGAAFLKQVNKVLGQDTLKKALHNYFQMYKWGNTEFNDFIGSLEAEYKLKQDTTMGEHFDFKEWCNSWLKTSGVNTFQPIVEYNADGSIKSLQIQQQVDPAGANRLRKSKMDIGFYD